jgi:L-asparaginase II
MLQDIGMQDNDRACGPSDPLSEQGRQQLHLLGELAGRLHNNCSGKHAAMLARASGAGWPHAGYATAGHKVQESVVKVVSNWTGVAPGAFVLAIDGCGVPVFGLPLKAMALSFARLGAASQRGEEIPARIIAAMREQPRMIAGAHRFDTVLIEETDGRVVAKVGAEGVHSLCIPELGLGAAVKVADGALRAQHSAVIRLLQLLGALPNTLTGRLQNFLCAPITNTLGDTVGAVRPADQQQQALAV